MSNIQNLIDKYSFELALLISNLKPEEIENFQWYPVFYENSYPLQLRFHIDPKKGTNPSVERCKEHFEIKSYKPVGNYGEFYMPGTLHHEVKEIERLKKILA